MLSLGTFLDLIILQNSILWIKNIKLEWPNWLQCKSFDLTEIFTLAHAVNKKYLGSFYHLLGSNYSLADLRWEQYE